MTEVADAAHPGPDLLAAFIEKNGVTKEAAAEALGVTRVTLWSWLERKSSPSQAPREDIATWTNGEVPEDSWPPLTDRRKRGARVQPFDGDTKGTGGKAA